jgi:hypothetical protein
MDTKVENKVTLLSDTLKEFFGDKWLEYLNRLNIEYHIRLRENFWVEKPANREWVKTKAHELSKLN